MKVTIEEYISEEKKPFIDIKDGSLWLDNFYDPKRQMRFFVMKEPDWIKFDFYQTYEIKFIDEVECDFITYHYRLAARLIDNTLIVSEYYGDKFEREGKMIPGITFMYDDLSGKQVNWHQVMIYRENELSPSQRYKQRLIGEITEKQEMLGDKKQELAELNKQRQQGGNVYGE